MAKKEPGMNGKHHKKAGGRDRIRTLIVDDSAVFREALGRFLQQWPHVEVVGVAEDGDQVLAQVAGTRPDLVLMDLQMPRINGLQATRRVRAKFPNVCVIMLTLHDSEPAKAASIAAGADRFIPKHRLCDELHGALARLFPGRNGRSEKGTRDRGKNQ